MSMGSISDDGGDWDMELEYAYDQGNSYGDGPGDGRGDYPDVTNTEFYILDKQECYTNHLG